MAPCSRLMGRSQPRARSSHERAAAVALHRLSGVSRHAGGNILRSAAMCGHWRNFETCFVFCCYLRGRSRPDRLESLQSWASYIVE